jgi:four helix bundle protein
MDYKSLDVWKLSIEIIKEIYTITKAYPKDESFNLTDQMRRSAISISSNIAEGSARNSDKEFLHFLYIALGSCSELETQIIISYELNYLTENQTHCTNNQIVDLKKCLVGLINHLKRKVLN